MQDDDRYERGLGRLAELQGPETAAAMREQLESISPTFARYAISTSYGEVYERAGLSVRERELITIGVVATMGGCEAQLRRHLAIALNAGLTPAELVETVVQITAYAGAPRGSNAIRVAAEVVAERGLTLP